MSKKCIKCLHIKALEFFDKNRSRPDGLCVYCKACEGERRKRNKKYMQTHYQVYRHILRERQKKYYIKNKEAAIKRASQWKANNLNKSKAYRREYHHKRKADGSLYYAIHRIRNLIKESLKKNGYSKKSRTREILGCDYQFFVEYISKKFRDGMSWENRSKWHIDHIIPLASAKTEEDIIRLCHYSNLQPLWAKENLSKGSKIINNQ